MASSNSGKAQSCLNFLQLLQDLQRENVFFGLYCKRYYGPDSCDSETNLLALGEDTPGASAADQLDSLKELDVD
ncbi:unnamed protein product [Clavelina lepadiformis]|uniref:Uncharacterized protein n=1 Tax=Clavelina lepadiformis TaxID=159417 RepID=A0ABP0G4J2_CLALP